MTSVSVLSACLGPISLGPVGDPYIHRPHVVPAHEATQYYETAPHDPWMPRPAIAPPGSIPRCGPWVRDGYTSIQVNVDPHGCNILGDAANEPSIAIDLTDPRKMVIGWRQFDSVESDFRQAGYAYSHDGGHTWVFSGSLAPGTFGSDPVLATNAEGVFFYVSLGLEELRLFRSADAGITWNTGTQVAPVFADKPWMAIDRTGGIGHDNIYLYWLGYNFTRSTDGGATFEPPLELPADTSFGTLAVGSSGTLYLTGAGNHTIAVQRAVDAADPTSTPEFEVVALQLPGSALTGPALDVIPWNGIGLLGQVWIAAHDSTTGSEVLYLTFLLRYWEDPLDLVDVAFLRSVDAGEHWTGPVAVNDDGPSSTSVQWFPVMSVAPNGRIDVIWNDTRNDPTGTSSPTHSELFYSYSIDEGDTWSPNVAVSVPFRHRAGWPDGSGKLGDYYHMRSDNLGVNVAYAATFNGEQDVYFLRIGPWDCNANQVPDEDDIADRTSLDANGNTVPDECEYRGDSDGDGLTTLRDYAAFQNCFASILVGQTASVGQAFQSVTQTGGAPLRHRHPRWCIPRRSSTEQGARSAWHARAGWHTGPGWHGRGGWHVRPKGGHVELDLTPRCNPACGLSDVDSDGAVSLPDIEGLTRLLTAP